MSIDWNIDIPWDMLAGRIEAAAPIALERGGEVLRGAAAENSPVRSGHLKASGGVTVYGSGADCYADVKFPGPYASVINRGMRADGTHIIRNHPGGGVQPGFLTVAVAEKREAILQEIADVVGQLS